MQAHAHSKTSSYYIELIVYIGLATKVAEGERKKTMCGTPNYMAPEIVERGQFHSFEVDVWALGVILYLMLFGRVIII